jgi:predicted nuclease of predicted toxin-antitoxin system
MLERAQEEDRILVTFDKDFGELAFGHGLLASSGVILFRNSIPPAEHVAKAGVRALKQRDDWVGHFSMIEDN